MTLFSERHGYLKPKDIIIRGQITEPIQNSICNWISTICKYNSEVIAFNYYEIEQHIWAYYFNQRMDTYDYRRDVIIEHILNEDVIWYEKLDLIEVFYRQLIQIKSKTPQYIYDCTELLNSEFERHNFAYRLIEGRFVEITSKEELESIEDALATQSDGVRTHLQTALQLLSASQGEPDYRNSIKESMSSVEQLCRSVTGKNTLGDALKHMKNKGVILNSVLRSAFEKLYGYTNNPDTGIRHALMDDSNTPTSAEAIYMLVTCSAFINYLNTKISV